MFKKQFPNQFTVSFLNKSITFFQKNRYNLTNPEPFNVCVREVKNTSYSSEEKHDFIVLKPVITNTFLIES